MKTKYSIECWIVDSQNEQALLLTVPAKGDTPAFNQPVTGGIEGAERWSYLFGQRGGKVKLQFC